MQFLLTSICASACGPSAEEPERVASAGARDARSSPAVDSCLAPGSLALGEFQLGEDTTFALDRAGEKPTAILHGESEDDGGVHEIRTYRFAGFEFDAVRGSVDGIRTTSDTMPGPGRIASGMRRVEVEERLRGLGINVRGAPDTLVIPDCGPPSSYLTLIFGRDGRVQAVEIAAERP